MSTHRQRLELDLGSRTTSHDFKPLGAPHRVRQAKTDAALLIYGRLPSAWVALRPWYRDRGLRRIVNTPHHAEATAAAQVPAPTRGLA